MYKQDLSEADICAKYITPAVVQAGWDEATQIRREVSFTRGRIIVRGKLVTRGKARRADYVLYYQHIPIALIEARTAITPWATACSKPWSTLPRSTSLLCSRPMVMALSGTTAPVPTPSSKQCCASTSSRALPRCGPTTAPGRGWPQLRNRLFCIPIMTTAVARSRAHASGPAQ